MKNIMIMVLITFSIFPVFVNAKQSPKSKLDKMTSELGLSEEQQQEIRLIHKHFADELRALRKGDLERDEFKAESEKLKIERKEKVVAILTVEQKKLAEEKRLLGYNKKKAKIEKKKQVHKYMKDNMSAEEHAEAMTNKMTSMFDLTDVQKEAVSKINRKFAYEYKQLLDSGENKASFRELKEIQKEELSEILSDSQMKKMDAMELRRKEMRNHRHKMHLYESTPRHEEE